MATVHDISGFQIFSDSEIGHAHMVAHRMLDMGRANKGHELLSNWLRGRTGEGAEWVHIQWHMLVFELAIGRWQSAYDRFTTQVLPAARTSDLAVTDAPSGLWRLALAAPAPIALPWEHVATRARQRLRAECKPYAALHDLLALAGARDVRSITGWMQQCRTDGDGDDVLFGFSRSCLALAQGDLLGAARDLEPVLPSLPSLGGSRAQNELFHQIYRFACESGSRAHVA